MFQMGEELSVCLTHIKSTFDGEKIKKNKKKLDESLSHWFHVLFTSCKKWLVREKLSSNGWSNSSKIFPLCLSFFLSNSLSFFLSFFQILFLSFFLSFKFSFFLSFFPILFLPFFLSWPAWFALECLPSFLFPIILSFSLFLSLSLSLSLFLFQRLSLNESTLSLLSPKFVDRLSR